LTYKNFYIASMGFNLVRRNFAIHLFTTVFLTIVLLADSAFAQQWKIPLRDITEDDPELDRVNAEAMEFLPDGKTVATAGYFYDGSMKTAVGEVRLRDVKDGSLKQALRGAATTYALRAGTLAISPNGKLIAAAGRIRQGKKYHRVLEMFDVERGNLLRTIQAGGAPITWVAFSPDGKSLATARNIGEIDLWDPNTGEKIKNFKLPDVWPIAFSRDGKTLVAGCDEGIISFRDIKSGNEMGKVDLSADLFSIGGLALSADGKFFAAGGWPKRRDESPVIVCEWNANAGKIEANVVRKFKGHEAHTYSVAFSPDGKLLASANQDKTAKLWDLQTGKEIKTITAHEDSVYDVAFSPKGDALVTLGRDALMLWSLKELQKGNRN